MSEALGKFFSALVRLEDAISDLVDELEEAFDDLADVFEEDEDDD